MSATASIFFDINLPNAATWFYFSLILTVALFFQFTRLLSLRNLDLITLFLLARGFLVLQEAHALLAAGYPNAPPGSEAARAFDRGQRELVMAYAWLVAGCGSRRRPRPRSGPSALSRTTNTISPHRASLR